MFYPRVLALCMVLLTGLAACSPEAAEQSPPTAAGAATDNPETAATPATAAPPPQDGITARAFLDQALAAAQAWQPDAQLYGVHTSYASSGHNAFWFYDVQSPAQGQCSRFRAMASGQFDNVEEAHDCMLSAPLATDFIDSPQAFAAATAAGFKHDEDVSLHLHVMRDDEVLPGPRPCWVANSAEYDTDPEQGIARKGWCVDPMSGEFVVRLSGFGRPARLEEPPPGAE
jgi:hypothetical protein